MGMSSACGDQIAEAGHEGRIHAGVGVRATHGISGMATLGSSSMFILVWCGTGPWVGNKEGGLRRCQD